MSCSWISVLPRSSFWERSGLLNFSLELHLQLRHRSAFPGVQLLSQEFHMPQSDHKYEMGVEITLMATVVLNTSRSVRNIFRKSQRHPFT